jgi:hypothetical protein
MTKLDEHADKFREHFKAVINDAQLDFVLILVERHNGQAESINARLVSNCPYDLARENCLRAAEQLATAVTTNEAPTQQVN